MAILALGSSGKLPLDHFKGLWVDDGLMVILHVVLRDLTLIGFHLLGQEVLAEGLLQQGISFVLLVPQHRGFDTSTCLHPHPINEVVKGVKPSKGVKFP